MKAGIITYYWSNNIGALIQSISLKDFLNQNINSINCQFETYLPKELILREQNSQLKTLNPIKYIKALQKNIILKKWKKNIAKLPMYSQTKNDFNKDVYIYGSDEIWNYENPFFKLDDYFFGSNNNNKKIAYAVSIGNLQFNYEKIPKSIKENICSFQKIIVRDENTFNFVNLITKKKPFIACDPSLLISPLIMLGENSGFVNFVEKINFILIYGIFFSKKQIVEIKNYAKKNKFKIISICYYNFWADKNILSVNPNDFIFLIKKSQIVMTSMFHGIILSYKNRKNFWYSHDPYRKNKVEFFIKKFDLKKRSIDLFDDEKINYKENHSEYIDWIEESKLQLINSF